ncbi:MAG: hypothetical protein Q4F65_11600 [Propionibacteriaceae bacterium]|nr:hypothetical protein [Propionibacteriaceae bacterium]
MTNDPKDGGDISSGFGDPEVDGPVSDEKAEAMLHGDREAEQDDQDDQGKDSGDA